MELPGARAFAPARCPACRTTFRARTDFAGYQLGEPLARSGLALLFRATDPVTGVEFALKLFRPPRGTEPEDLGRFVANTRAAVGIDHPHCARVFGAGVEEGLAWVAMELLTGGTLAGRLAGVGRLSEAETLKLGLQAAAALAAAQAAGLTHRDLEPSAFVFDEAATLKVTDFGQAVLYERLSGDVGIIRGRPAFVAPERLARAEEDAITDIYALGTTLFYALTGTPPYGGEAHGQILFDRMGNEPLRVENHVRPIQSTTAAVLNRMLAAGRARRFQSWQEVIEHLTRAHTELTGRAAPAAPAPHPVQVPAPRVAPAAFPVGPALPPSARAPVVTASHAGSWVTLAMVAAIVALLAFVGWKQWFAPKPRAVLAARPPLATVAPAAVFETPLPATPAAKPARAAKGVDWSAWKTARLEAPTRQGTVTGSASVVPGSGALRLRGSSSGLAGMHDESAFHSRELAGDWTLVARIAASDGAAGLVARESAGSSRPMLAIWIAADGKLITAVRRQPDSRAEVSKPTASAKPPWLKLMRRGSVFAAHYSADGKTWKALAKLEGVTLPPKVPAGFVVWSGTKERTASATFDRVTLTVAK